MTAAADIRALLASRESVAAAVSRATWFRDASWLKKAASVPVVGGQTVWDTVPRGSGRLLVVEQPNFFGRFERKAPTGDDAVTVRRWGSVDADPGLLVTEMEAEAGSTEVARNLAGRLRQIPGVRLLHGHPESPWFVINLPARPEVVGADLASVGFEGCTALGTKFPEFPGGLRIEVAWPESENDRFARIVRTAMEL